MNIPNYFLNYSPQAKRNQHHRNSQTISSGRNLNLTKKTNDIYPPEGFTLTELLVAIAIIGILSSVALPNYFNQVQKTRQNEAATTLTQVQTTIAAYADEMGLLPAKWSELNKITPLMTPEGPADKNNFSPVSIASAGCTKVSGKNCYKVIVKEKDQLFNLEAKSNNSDAANYNVVACLNLRTGASDLKKGTSSNKASLKDLRCVRKAS